MTPRRLILHVGVPKTGSTSLHHFIKRNEAALADVVALATPRYEVSLRPSARAAIAYSLAPQPDTEAALRREFAEALRQIPQNDLPVLLTHENLAGAMPGNGGEVRLFPMLAQIARILREVAVGWDMQLVYYSRNVEKWRPSVWAQAVHTDGYAGTFEKFIDDTRNLPDWSDLTDRLIAVLGFDKVFHFRLEDEPEILRPGRQLFRLIGMSADAFDKLRPLERPGMTRLNAASTEFLRQLNALSLNPHARNSVARLVARNQPMFNAEYRPQGIL